MSLIGNLSVKEKIIGVEYPDIDGFIVELAFLSREELVKINKQSTIIQFSKITRQREEVLDQDKFLQTYTKKAIKGWKGLKVKDLPKLLAVDLSSYKNLEEEVPYTEEDAMELIKNSVSFDRFITDAMQDYQKFSVDKRETDIKN